LLVHYVPTIGLVLCCDASQYGFGAVLSQVYDKLEKPVAHASRSLLLGQKFTLCTDHKPLQSLLNGSKAVPTIVSARIQRWALTLSMHEYTINSRVALLTVIQMH